MEGMGVRHLLGLLRVFGSMASTSWTHIASRDPPVMPL